MGVYSYKNFQLPFGKKKKSKYAPKQDAPQALLVHGKLLGA